MEVPFIGPTYQMEATSFDNQRCVNLYPIMSETGTSKSVAALRGTPGLKLFASVGGGPIRAGIEVNGRSFFVSGSDFYEVFADGTSTLQGSLSTSTSDVAMTDNPTQIMIIDGSFGYIFTLATNTLVQISDADFPIPSSLTFQDGYFIISEANSSKFWISGLNNGLTWGALDFTTVENAPDDLVSVYSDSSNLWAFGTQSTEIFQNTGNSTFPFQVINGAYIETGCAAPLTVQELDNTLLWLGTDKNGDSVVWRASGYNAQRVSTQAIELKISESDNFNESYAWVYHERGHAFYCLQVKGLKTTLVLDMATGLWHERIYRNPVTNQEEQHRASCHVFFKQKHLVGDRQTGKVYELNLDFYSDNGDPIVRERISPHYSELRQLVTHSQFELDMEVGVGTQTGQGKEPEIMMAYSDSGGHTWSNELWRSLGAVGNYKTRVRWNKLGRTRDRVYKVKISDPVFVQINAAYLNGY